LVLKIIINEYLYLVNYNFVYAEDNDYSQHSFKSSAFWSWEFDVELIGMQTYEILRVILHYEILGVI